MSTRTAFPALRRIGAASSIAFVIGLTVMPVANAVQAGDGGCHTLRRTNA